MGGWGVELRLVPRAGVEPARDDPKHILQRDRGRGEAVIFQNGQRDYERIEHDAGYVELL